MPNNVAECRPLKESLCSKNQSPFGARIYVLSFLTLAVLNPRAVCQVAAIDVRVKMPAQSPVGTATTKVPTAFRPVVKPQQLNVTPEQDRLVRYFDMKVRQSNSPGLMSAIYSLEELTRNPAPYQKPVRKGGLFFPGRLVPEYKLSDIWDAQKWVDYKSGRLRIGHDERQALEDQLTNLGKTASAQAFDRILRQRMGKGPGSISWGRLMVEGLGTAIKGEDWLCRKPR